jgi:hypothetical protein
VVYTDISSEGDCVSAGSGNDSEVCFGITAGKPVENSEHIIYIGQDGGLHELYLSRPGNGHWVDRNLTAGGPRAPYPLPETPLAGYSFEVYYAAGTPAESSEHILYIDTANLHLHELWLSRPDAGDWVHDDLTVNVGAEPFARRFSFGRPTLVTPLATYTFVALDPNNHGEHSQHVIYIGQDGNIHELYLTRPGGSVDWTDRNLTANLDARSQPLITSFLVSPLTAFSHVVHDKDGKILESSEHVIYVGANNHLHELWVSRPGGSDWSHEDINDRVGAELPLVTPFLVTPLAGYSFVAPTVLPYPGEQTWENSMHVIYGGMDGELHELYLSRPSDAPDWAERPLTGTSLIAVKGAPSPWIQFGATVIPRPPRPPLPGL